MDAKFLGFSIEFKSKNLGFDDYMKFMAESSPHEVSANNDNSRLLYINSDSHEKYYLGMIITVRNQKKYCKAKMKNKDFTFNVVDLKGGDKILEFNYFIIDKTSNLGLYQYYHQSCSTRQFGQIIKKFAQHYSRSQSEVAIEMEGNKLERELSGHRKTQIRAPYRVEMNFSILAREETLKDILAGYEKIKSFEYEFATLTPKIMAATPLSKYVERKKETLVFTTPRNVGDLSKGICDVLRNFKLKTGRVKVEDEDGNEFPLNIFDIPDFFACYDYDDLADSLMNVKASEFYYSDLVNYLIEAFESEDNEHIFQVEFEDEA